MGFLSKALDLKKPIALPFTQPQQTRRPKTVPASLLSCRRASNQDMGSPITAAPSPAPAAMPVDATASDVDFLDAVVDLDAQWYEEGRREGVAAGRARGREEGRAVG